MALTKQNDYFARNPGAGTWQPGMPDLSMGSSQFSDELRQRNRAGMHTDLAIDALMKQAGARRDIALADQAAEDYDTTYRGPQRAQVGNQIADITSEGAAGRQFLPNASKLYQRNRGAALEDANMRYLQPAMIGAQADLDAADIAGQSRVAAAGVRGPAGKSQDEIMLDGLLKAAMGQLELEGMTPEKFNTNMGMMRQYFAQPGQPR
jgi:hypothetical protein